MKHLQKKQLFRYTACGALTTALHYLVFLLLAHRAGFSLSFSDGCAWAVSVVFAFFGNKTYVFQSKSFRPAVLLRQAGAFLACRGLTGFMELRILLVFVQLLGFHDIAVKAAVNPLVILLNYILSIAFVFQRKDRTLNA